MNSNKARSNGELIPKSIELGGGSQRRQVRPPIPLSNYSTSQEKENSVPRIPSKPKELVDYRVIGLTTFQFPTSTTVVLAALHIGWLKFLAVFLQKKRKQIIIGRYNNMTKDFSENATTSISVIEMQIFSSNS